MKKQSVIILIILSIFIFNFNFAKAEEKEVDYGSSVVIDSDLDGLTNEGEKQIYATEPKNPDTDRDGILDGVEVINGADPLDSASPSIAEAYSANLKEIEVPWGWYLTRVSALIGFFILYLSIFFGIAIRNPLLRKMISPIYSLDIHGWISLQALLFALLHGVSLLFDKFLAFNLANVFVPFFPLSESATKAGVQPLYLAMGVVSFYLMLVLVVSSYLRKFINFRVWRFIHFFNLLLWIFVILHALQLGTDMKNVIVRNIFIYANVFLMFLFVVNLISRIFNSIKQRINTNS
ncbi:MAG: hypothetical protein WC678_03495 [Parcubacteria group bacterium]|jgi:sulfoxide reductase heme-binding subunit YedZ